MRAIVVGGGIGGLAAGIALTRAGWDVRVLEKRDRPRELGAGISLWPNALTALDRLDVWPEIRSTAAMELGGARTPDGRWLARLTQLDGRAAGPFEILLVHRAQLHLELLRALPARSFVSGVEVSSVLPDGTVVHGDGTHAADLVVVADGVHSGLREQIWPDAPGARYAGFTAWRGVTDEAFDLDGGATTWGRGAEFGATIMVDGRVYWFATANRPAGERRPDERAEVLRRFEGWHAPIGEIVRATSPNSVLRHDIFALPTPLAPFNRGRVALLGDAAHAMTPNLGQGGGQALEDAVSLAAVVGNGGLTRDLRDIEAALARYDALRRPRTQRFVRASAALARVSQTENRIAAGARDLLTRVVPARYPSAALARMLRWTPPE